MAKEKSVEQKLKEMGMPEEDIDLTLWCLGEAEALAECDPKNYDSLLKDALFNLFGEPGYEIYNILFVY